jgi:ADP-ribose pyrophosphatase YjhB (NUDIX family)
MAMQLHTHCSYCGAAFPPKSPWPRTCAACGNVTFRNPLPVCVVLVPIQAEGRLGLLAVRRAIPPHIGEIALPGGYINYGETWQEAGAREIFEEANVTIDPAEITEFRVRSAPDGTLIIFGLAHPRHLDALPPFQSNSEASQRLILFEPAPMAFELHTEIAGQFLNAK